MTRETLPALEFCPLVLGQCDIGFRVNFASALTLTQDIWLTCHTALRGSARIRVVADFIAERFENALL